jgi:hypothetical protein
MQLFVIPADKANHVVYGMVIYVFMLVICSAFRFGYAWDVVAMGTVVVAAVGRETWNQWVDTTKFDPYDMLSTMFGGAAVYLARHLG